MLATRDDSKCVTQVESMVCAILLVGRQSVKRVTKCPLLPTRSPLMSKYNKESYTQFQVTGCSLLCAM